MTLFQDNAESFALVGTHTRGGGAGAGLYLIAIAIELSLKAYLLHRGASDKWNRVHIRHDLLKALTYAQRAGLEPVGQDVLETIAILSKPYSHHTLNSCVGGSQPPVSLRQATGAARDLIALVRRGTASSDNDVPLAVQRER